MYDRTEIAEAYFDSPTPAHFGLSDLIVSDALLHPHDPAFESFRSAIRTDGSNPAGFGPGDVAEPLAALIDPDYPDRPIGWHFQRALHRSAFRMEPPIRPAARRVVETHRQAVARWADDHASAFLYLGLSLSTDTKQARDHVLTHAGQDLQVVAFCHRSWAFNPRSCDPTLASLLLRCTLRAITAQGTDDGGGGLTLGVDHALPDGALDWLEAAVGERRDFLTLLGTEQVPVSVVELRGRAGSPDSPFAEFPQGQREVFRLDSVRPPPDPATAVTAVVQICHGNPHAATAFVYLVRQLSEPPDDADLRKLAACGWPLLAAIVDRGWVQALRDAGELVPVALAIPYPAQRVRALVALGRPAASALGELVDAMLAALSGDRDPFAPSLAQIADAATVLGLPFWEKRLERPGAFPELWPSTRLRQAFTLRPEPVYRLIRRAAKKADKRGRSAGVQVLAALHTSWETFSLGPVADDVVALLGAEDRLHWNTRFNLLANAGSPAALTMLGSMAESGQREDISVEAALFEDAWNALAPTGRTDAGLLADALLDCSFEVCPSAAAAVIALLAYEFAEPNAVAARPANEFGRCAEADLVVRLLVKHRRSLPAGLVDVALGAFDGQVTAAVHSAFRNPSDVEFPREVPWDELPDEDLGHLVPEIGEWVAARVDRPKLDVPMLLGRAIRAHHRRILGDHGEPIMTALGEEWPTRRLLADAAERAGIELQADALDRCADEALPPVFRAGLAGLPKTIEADGESPYSPHHWLVRWVFETAWQHSPELLGRHLLPEFEGSSESRWKQGLASALVALREPVGTSVADALTAAMHKAETQDAHDFYQRQRDTFARASVAREQAWEPWMRTRDAWTRLRRAARLHRGV